MMTMLNKNYEYIKIQSSYTSLQIMAVLSKILQGVQSFQAGLSYAILQACKTKVFIMAFL